MIELILPPEVRTAERRDDVTDSALFPEEERAVSNAVARRRREYTTVRFCARQALAKLGYPPIPIVPGELGSPGWPSDVVGSMTHCDGYRAAAVAHRSAFVSIGIDAEPSGPLPDGVLEMIALPEERQSLHELSHRFPTVHWGRVLFSAKESVYKTWSPMTKRWLGFEDAVVEINPETSRFQARILRDVGSSPQEFQGCWLVEDGLVMTAIAHTL